jgi:hypothetical protein
MSETTRTPKFAVGDTVKLLYPLPNEEPGTNTKAEILSVDVPEDETVAIQYRVEVDNDAYPALTFSEDAFL